MDTEFNGWTNYETWNVALYFANDYAWYTLRLSVPSYAEAIAKLAERGVTHTPDGIALRDPQIKTDEIEADWAEA